MVEIDKKKIARNEAINKFAEFIAKNLPFTEWTLIAEEGGVIDILNEPRHKRVEEARSWGDSDYPEAVSKFLKEVFDTDEEVGLFLIHKYIQHDNPYNEELSQEAKGELDQILSMFKSQTTDMTSLLRSFQPSVGNEFINVTWMPDDFYKKLIDEINQLYMKGLPMSLSILIRKLLENLVIDVLRKKYGTTNLSLYYDTSRRRFHDFSVLLRNLDSKKADFNYITSNLDTPFIRNINQYRETGNSGAHSIDANLTIDQFSKDKENINYLVQLLLRILKNP